MGLEDRSATLERLKEAAEQTKALYLGAKECLVRAKGLRADLGPTHPDGTLGIALAFHGVALQNYSRALWRYNRFLLDGELPEEEKRTNTDLAHYFSSTLRGRVVYS